ncbi:MAG: 4'-phosphopantetheinyl transferase family protein [Planctomycetota bacterium]
MKSERDQTLLLTACRPDAVAESALEAHYRTTLDDEERARADRFHFDRDRRLYVASHALVRLALADAVPTIEPANWRFVRNAYGKPSVASGEAGEVRFNLSHTRGMAVVGIAWGRAIGIDIESLDRKRGPGDPAELERLADRFFAPAEAAAVRAAPPAAKTEAFFVRWTLKEAYIKARGMGVSLPLDRFAWTVAAAERALSLWTDPSLADPPDHWDAWCCAVPPAFRVALAVERLDAPSPPEPRLFITDLADGVDEQPLRVLARTREE